MSAKTTTRRNFNPKCRTTDISSVNYSGTRTSIEYDNDGTLEIKEEIIEDRETSAESILKTILTDNKPYSETEPRIQKSKNEPEKRYACEKCARRYTMKYNLTAHQKYDCNVFPMFKCKFCKKRFKRKGPMNKHVESVHLKTNLHRSKIRHKCDKCPRSYSWRRNLTRHKRSVHEANEPKLVCDHCGHKTTRKNLLLEHIMSLHLK
ncbi:zinc finger protein 676-like [Belonocnema kinseyi]|uniref:zinc finger protein 676-like n=1 Tax=Belonocnema kinseyi TaxID=2817044 RepID=UPI00143D1B0A|nr:zinc finger protein 676-like [Belonocnema kinseyi]